MFPGGPSGKGKMAQELSWQPALWGNSASLMIHQGKSCLQEGAEDPLATSLQFTSFGLTSQILSVAIKFSEV